LADPELIHRLATLSLGECLAALGTTEGTDEALRVFREAAANFEGRIESLVAHVHIAHLLLRQDDLEEAARTIERARWLLRSIPADAFAGAPISADQREWERYLSTVAGSSLFRDVFAARQSTASALPGTAP
jgi:hypothetical protein